MPKSNKLILISLNELNFDKIDKYISKHKLECIKKLKQNIVKTQSEKEYENLEPWIQWVSIYYGKKAKEHKVKRLGEKIKENYENIFQTLEKKGFKVGAISPMNIFNNLNNPNYFIPDPWTETTSDKSYWSKLVHSSTSKLVKGNVRKNFDIKSYIFLLIVFLRFARLKNYYYYFKFFLRGIKKKWFKALFFDLLLHDIHLRKIKNSKTEFSNIFFNSLAHIQHHYFFNSIYTKDKNKNPEWYISKQDDPLKDGLIIFDKILSDYFKLLNQYKIIVATGLTQTPYDMVKYYYRMKNHKLFFSFFGINISHVQELMSRDFVINFEKIDDADKAYKIIKNIKTSENDYIFGDITQNQNSIFITLIYNQEINNQIITLNEINKRIELKNYVDFVAIKNGMHNEKGFLYFSDKKFSENFEIHNLKKEIEEIIINE